MHNPTTTAEYRDVTGEIHEEDATEQLRIQEKIKISVAKWN
jgi:hypothetical protein